MVSRPIRPAAAVRAAAAVCYRDRCPAHRSEGHDEYRCRNPAAPSPAPGQTPEQAERLRQIAKKQGTLGKSRLENVVRVWDGLWKSDEEYERFLELLREIRHPGE